MITEHYQSLCSLFPRIFFSGSKVAFRNFLIPSSMALAPSLPKIPICWKYLNGYGLMESRNFLPAFGFLLGYFFFFPGRGWKTKESWNDICRFFFPNNFLNKFSLWVTKPINTLWNHITASDFSYCWEMRNQILPFILHSNSHWAGCYLGSDITARFKRNYFDLSLFSLFR